MERGRIQGLRKFFSVPPIISGTGKLATNFKLGRYIHRVYRNESPLKFWEKMERGHIQGLPQFFEYPLLSQEPIKLKFGRRIHRVHPNKIPLKLLRENGAWANSGTLQIFEV